MLIKYSNLMIENDKLCKSSVNIQFVENLSTVSSHIVNTDNANLPFKKV